MIVKIQIFLLCALTVCGLFSTWCVHSEWLFLPIIMIMALVALEGLSLERMVIIVFPVFMGGLIFNPDLEGLMPILLLITPFMYAFLLRHYWNWLSPLMATIFLVTFSIVMLSGLFYSSTVDNCKFGVSMAEKGVSAEEIDFCKSLNLYEPSYHMSKEGLIRSPRIIVNLVLWGFYIYSLVLFLFTFLRNKDDMGTFEERDRELEQELDNAYGKNSTNDTSSRFTKRRIIKKD